MPFALRKVPGPDIEPAVITLWHAWSCPYCQRVRIVLDEKGIRWEDREIDLARKPPEVTEMNPPHGGVPILVDDGAVIPDSLVIIQYLDERYPGPALAPGDPLGRARMRLVFERCGALAQAVGKLVKGGPEVQEAAAREARQALELLEPEVASSGYLLGPFSLADAAVAPFVRRLPGHLQPAALGLSRLAGWWDRIRARPAVARHTAPRAGAPAPSGATRS